MGFELALPGRSPLSPDPAYIPLVGPAVNPLRWRGGVSGVGCGCGVGRRRLAGLGFESSGNPTTDPIDWGSIDWSFDDFNPFGDTSPAVFGGSATGGSTNLVPLAALGGALAAVLLMRMGGKKGRRR